MARAAADRVAAMIRAALRRPPPTGQPVDPAETRADVRRATRRQIAAQHEAPKPAPPPKEG